MPFFIRTVRCSSMTVLAAISQLRQSFTTLGLAPRHWSALKLVLRDGAAFVHALHGADAALVAAGQNCDLSFLAEVAVGSVLLHGHVVHHGGGLAIDVLALPESLQGPFLAGDPRQHSGLDGREVRDHEATAL